MLKIKDHTLLIDANTPDLLTRFPSDTIDMILLTHFHMDHVQSLFDLRQGVGQQIPVMAPDDPKGCDDLYKHPGILDFSQKTMPFKPFKWQGITVTPVPLQHSKLCLGYVFEYQASKIAYLTDTNELSDESTLFLKALALDWMIIDCNDPPIADRTQQALRNHNDFTTVQALQASYKANKVGLVHLSHQMLAWALAHQDAIPANIHLLWDGFEITFSTKLSHKVMFA